MDTKSVVEAFKRMGMEGDYPEFIIINPRDMAMLWAMHHRSPWRVYRLLLEVRSWRRDIRDAMKEWRRFHRGWGGKVPSW